MYRILDRSGGCCPVSVGSSIKIVIFRYYGQIRLRQTIIANIPRKPPIVFPQEQRLLSSLRERLRLARKRPN